MQEVIDQFLRSFKESRQYQINLPEAVIGKGSQVDTTSQFGSIPPSLADVVAEESDVHQVSQFLGQLRYPGMADRHERIAEAHKKTFD